MKKFTFTLFLIFLSLFSISVASAYSIVIEQKSENIYDSILIPESEIDLTELIQRFSTFNVLGYPAYPNDIEFDVIGDYDLDDFIDFDEFSASIYKPNRVYCENKIDSALNKSVKAMNIFSNYPDSAIILHTSDDLYTDNTIVFEIAFNIASISSVSQLFNFTIDGTNFHREIYLLFINNKALVGLSDSNWSSDSVPSESIQINSLDTIAISYEFNATYHNITLKNYNSNENVSLAFSKEFVAININFERIIIRQYHNINSEFNIFAINSNLNPQFKPTYSLANQPLIYSAKLNDIDSYYYPYQYGSNISAEFEGFTYNRTLLALEQYNTLCYTNYTNQLGLADGLFLAIDDSQMIQKQFEPLQKSQMYHFGHEKRNGNFVSFKNLSFFFTETLHNNVIRYVRINNAQNLTEIYVKANYTAVESKIATIEHNYQKEFPFLYMYAEVNDSIYLALKIDNNDYMYELYDYSIANNISIQIESRGPGPNVFLFISSIGCDLFDFSHNAKYTFIDKIEGTSASDLFTITTSSQGYALYLDFLLGHKNIVNVTRKLSSGYTIIYPRFTSDFFKERYGIFQIWIYVPSDSYSMYIYPVGELPYSANTIISIRKSLCSFHGSNYVLSDGWHNYRIETFFNGSHSNTALYIDNIYRKNYSVAASSSLYYFARMQLDAGASTYQHFYFDAYDISKDTSFYINRNYEFLDFSANSDKRIILQRNINESYQLEYTIPRYIPVEEYMSYNHKVSRILIESDFSYNESEFLDLNKYGIVNFVLFPSFYAEFEIESDIINVQNEISQIVSNFIFVSDISLDITFIINALSRYSDLYITINSTIALEFVYLIEELPEGLISAIMSLVSPLLMYLIIPLAFFTKWKAKGAAVGFVLSAIINIIALTIPLFYAIIVLILAVFTAIMMLKQKEGVSSD